MAFILCLVIGLTGCSSSNPEKDTGIISNAESITNFEESNIEFSGMDDDALLTYVKDKVYEETVNNLDSEKYVVEEVRITYLSKEYLEETSYNSQSNIYFGYTLEELNDFFQGDRYIFNLSDKGTTTVEKLQEVAETDSQQVIKNVAIGTGVILVCVTVSVVSAGAPAAVTAVFAASAKSATAFALSSGTFSAVSAGIIRGYQTGDMNEALDAVALAGSEGFKWGAIAGAITGGGEEAFLLKSGTKGGLTMSEVATIQKESKYPVELISKFNSMEQYDELWNLMPMDSSLNSAKSNRLPKWNPFFEVFAGNQYLMYEMINERPDLHKRFEACYRDNLHSIWAGQELYRKGNSREVFYNILERNMMPVYDSARRQGYEIWNYG